MNLVGSQDAACCAIAVGGTRLKHEGAEGIAGILGVLDEALPEWIRGVTKLTLVWERDDAGRVVARLLKVECSEDDAAVFDQEMLLTDED
jgi:hypothetical protein